MIFATDNIIVSVALTTFIVRLITWGILYFPHTKTCFSASFLSFESTLNHRIIHFDLSKIAETEWPVLIYKYSTTLCTQPNNANTDCAIDTLCHILKLTNFKNLWHGFYIYLSSLLFKLWINILIWLEESYPMHLIGYADCNSKNFALKFLVLECAPLLFRWKNLKIP